MNLSQPDYEIDPVLPDIPPRSRLFHLAPIGVGTRSVESLTSYISRLAVAHSVTTGTLVTRDISHTMMAGAIPTDLCTGYFAVKRAGEGVNSLASPARDWAEALQKLTLRRDIVPLTMLHWAGLIHPLGLMRERKAWCPACYQQERERNCEPYDQLLWAVQDAICCQDHGCLLVSLCPHCGRHNPHLGWRGRPGYCNSCYEWLGTKNVDEKGVTAWDRWRTAEVATLLSVPMGEGGRSLSQVPPKKRIMEALRALARGRGIKKTGKLAKFLGFRREGVVDWFYGYVYPSFSSLLIICAKFRVPLLDYLFADIETIATQPPNDDIPDPPIRVYRRRPKSELEAILRNALQKGDPADSLRTICERAGWGRSGAHANCRELSKQIAARRRKHLQEKTLAKKQVVVLTARSLIQQLRSEGVNLQAVAIAQRLKNPGVLRAKWGREAFAEALQAEGIEPPLNFCAAEVQRVSLQVKTD
jgi:TniQ